MSGSTAGSGGNRRPLLFGMLGGVALLLAACGGGDEEPAVSTTEVVATTPEATPTAAPTLTATATAAATGTVYTVEAGDTALAIAIEFDISLAELAEANGVTEAELDNLQIGQELRIPGATP